MKRYQVIKRWNDTTEVVGSTNKRRTAHRICACHEAGNRSRATWFEVTDRNGQEVVPSRSRYKRELRWAQWWHDRSTVAARGVW